MWNERLHSIIVEDMHELRSQGYLISIWGDFNGHVAMKDRLKGIYETSNTNGERVERLVEAMGGSLMNDSHKCEGIWTWNRGQHKSIIDLVIADGRMSNRIRRMMVDDDEMEGAREPPSYSEASGSCVDDLFSESSFDLDRIRNLACF